MAYQQIPSPEVIHMTRPLQYRLGSRADIQPASMESFGNESTTKLNESTQYKPLPMEQPLLDRPSERSKKGWLRLGLASMASRKTRICFLFSVAVGLAWMVPIIFLLVVNIQGKSLGASAWCPLGETCTVINYTDLSGSSTTAQGADYDRKNHNLLGGLQFVAKALEVWFVFLATSLVWQFTVLLARRPEGLPIGFILTHLEFADLRVLLDPILYSTSTARSRNPKYAKHLRLFVALAVLMCIVANLMGPSVAVLLIPTLDYRNQPRNVTSQFNQLLSAKPPTGDNGISGCTATELENSQYNCSIYWNVLESLSTSLRNELAQNLDTHPDLFNQSNTYNTSITAITTEHLVPFGFNTTTLKGNSTASRVAWAPVRQTIQELSQDFDDVYSVFTGSTVNKTSLDRYTPYLSSLQLIIQRFSPIIGVQLYSTVGDYAVTYVAEDREIRCYHNYDGFSNQTKCMRTGEGWNTTDAKRTFAIDRDEPYAMAAVVYWSDRAVMLNDTNDPCFREGNLTSDANCDWDAIFSDENTASSSADPSGSGDNTWSLDRMRDMLVIEWGYNSNDTDSLILEVFPGFGFATYSLDITKIYPTLKPMQIRDTPDPEKLTPMVLHPSWVLAGWRVANEGELYTNNSDAAALMQSSLMDWFTRNATFETLDEAFYVAHGVTWYALLHGLSMIPYGTNPVPSDTSNLPPLQPLLWNNVYNRVWGWSIESRTSKLGIVVTILGILTAVARTILLFWTRAKESSSIGLMISAAKYQHQGELDHSSSEHENAKVRYQLLGKGDDMANVSLLHVS